MKVTNGVIRNGGIRAALTPLRQMSDLGINKIKLTDSIALVNSNKHALVNFVMKAVIKDKISAFLMTFQHCVA